MVIMSCRLLQGEELSRRRSSRTVDSDGTGPGIGVEQLLAMDCRPGLTVTCQT